MNRPMRTTPVLALALMLAGCGAESRTADGQPADTAGGSRAVAPETGAATPGPTGSPRPARLSDTLPVTVESANPAEWTAGVTRVERTYVGVGTVVATRIARHDDFERLVLELAAGDTVPGYHVEYVDRPVRQCGSGNPVELAGDAWLSVRLEPARAHTEEGQSTIGERRLRPAQPVVLEAVLTCDFEAQVEWVLGVSSPNRYRVLELTDPARLIIDIRGD